MTVPTDISTPPITWYDRLDPHKPRAMIVTVTAVDPATGTCTVSPEDGELLEEVSYYGGGDPEIGDVLVALEFDGTLALLAGGGGTGRGDGAFRNIASLKRTTNLPADTTAAYEVLKYRLPAELCVPGKRFRAFGLVTIRPAADGMYSRLNIVAGPGITPGAVATGTFAETYIDHRIVGRIVGMTVVGEWTYTGVAGAANMDVLFYCVPGGGAENMALLGTRPATLIIDEILDEDDGSGPGGLRAEEVVISASEPAYVSGLELWVDLDEVAAVTDSQEVWIGNLVPPRAEIELWYDTNAMPTTRSERAGEPGVLKVRDPNNPTVWTELASASGGSSGGGGGADEVWVDSAVPAAEIELWVDTSAVPPPVVDEVAIQTGDPTAMTPSVELWVDTDEPFTQPTGPAGPAGVDGATGATGPTGPMGVSTVIIGSIGDVASPADLPPDGLIPADFDGPGEPAAEYQMTVGESLYLDRVGDPLDGHLFQYVTTTVDPLGWIDVGLIQGPAGPSGPSGATGPAGPAGAVGLPPGGTTHQALLKITDADSDADWADVIRRGTGHGLVDQVISGGLSLPDAQIKFGSRLGSLINMYGGVFGFGIESGTLVAYVPAANKFAVRAANTTGTEWAYIDANGLGPRTNSNVVWQNGFSGTCACRVNPSTVTISMYSIKRNVSTVNTYVKMFDYPAGVPAPWMHLKVAVQVTNESFAVQNNARGYVEFLTTGVFLRIFNGEAMNGTDHQISATCTWAR